MPAPTPQSDPVSITVTSDFICPWCTIGEARLQAALAHLPDSVAVRVTWLPYELNPNMPTDGMSRREYRTRKFGSWDRSKALDAHTLAASAEDGVVLNYDKITRTPNTFNAHRLAWFAGQNGRQHDAALALFKAYFQDGRDIGDLAVLTDIGGEIGLEPAAVSAFLHGDAGTQEVRALENEAVAQGIQGVPHFDIDGESYSGALPADAIHAAILNAANRPD